MTSQLEKTLVRPRQCAADWLVIQARELARLATQHNSATLLVFACLEARNAIEQLWFELLMLIHGGQMERDLFERCRKRRDGFLAAIGDAEPRYRKLSRFTAIVTDLDQRAPHQGIAWDLGRLKKLWHALSPYCHAQAHPAATLEDPHWMKEGLALVEELFSYLEKEMSHGASALLKVENMTRDARMIWDEFAIGKIDEEQVRIRLQLVQPLRT